MAIDPELLKKQTNAAQTATEVPQTSYITNTNATYRIGSSGDGVKELQQALISKNYLAAGGDDGIYGKNTAAAVKQYQKDNGLSVDGIAGKNTLASLNGNKGGNSQTTTDQGTVSKEFSYGDAVNSDTVNQALALLQQQQAAKPGEYSPAWQDKADSFLSEYQNREPFSYDINEDALYQMYRDMYVQQGQMAMMDAIGQTAAMNGGYGNSYAQAAGQQAYHQYLNQLNAIVPELYQMAQNRYDLEGQRMLDMYNLYTDRENQAYAKHQDSMDRWYQEVARLQGNYDTLLDRLHQADREKVADEQWQKQYDLQKKASRSSGGGTPTVEYKDFDYEEQQKWADKFIIAAESGDVKKVERVGTEMAQAGIDPAIVGDWTTYYASTVSNGSSVSDKVGDWLNNALDWLKVWK